MIWQAWYYLVFWVLGVLVYIGNAGKYREPYPEGSRLIILLTLMSFSCLVVLSGMGVFS